MFLSDDHFFLKLRTSRKNMVFSAVNSLAAAHAINGSMLCSMLNSRACIDALDFNSLEYTTVDDFVDVID